MKNSFSVLKEYIISISLFILIGCFALYGIREAKYAQSREAIRAAEESVKRAAVSCYALEGNYPPNYEYLKENYGLSVNEEKFTVFYEIFASNIMPEITVVETEG